MRSPSPEAVSALKPEVALNVPTLLGVEKEVRL